MQIPLLSGVIAGPAAEFIPTFPLNLEPVAVDAKIGAGQLRAAAGTEAIGTGPGPDRGATAWDGTVYRAMGNSLVSVAADGTVTSRGGPVPGAGPVRMDYSFDRLIVVADRKLFYYAPALIQGDGFTQVTDEDLGTVIDAIWIDGYTMTTDGTYVIVTELNDPFQVKPLKYGSAESDPDPITGLLRYREEAYVFGLHTIQTLRNVGGSGFPFQTVRGGTIPFGCVAPSAKCLWGDGFAFVGSARGEALNVYAGGQGQAVPFGNRALTDALASVEDTTAIELEARSYGNEQRLLIHLPDESWCFLVNASKALGQPIWYRLQSDGPYRIRNSVELNGRLMVGDLKSGNLGYLTDTDPRHWGEDVEWEFHAGKLYNNGKGAIIHSVELVGLPGRGTGEASMFLSMTHDGESFTQERALRVKLGERRKRLQWRPHIRMSLYMGFRFRGTGLPGIAALEVEAEGLE